MFETNSNEEIRAGAFEWYIIIIISYFSNGALHAAASTSLKSTVK